MSTATQNLQFSFEVVAPVFCIVLLGFVLRRRQMITAEFISVSSRLVFHITLPIFVFVKLANADFLQAFDGRIVGLAVGSTLCVYLFAWILAAVMIEDGKSQGAFIQGVYRSNYAIIGFAIVFNMHGDAGLNKAVILLSIILPLYNLLAILALTIPARQGRVSKKELLANILTNPLNIAALCGIGVSVLRLPLGRVVVDTANYLAALTLPLALIGIGGSLTFQSATSCLKEAALASGIKIVAYPLIFGSIAYGFGFRGEDFGVLFVLFASPTAVVSFIMAQATGNNADLAANIVLFSTIGSVITLPTGIFLLRSFGLL